MKNQYYSKFSVQTTFITLGVCFVLACLTIIAGINNGLNTGLLVGAILLALVMLAYTIKPKRIFLTGDQITIEFPFSKKSIPLAQIVEVHQVSNIPIIRFGSYGFFGYLGVAADGTICKVSNPTQMFLIAFNPASKLLLSCINSSELVKTINAHLNEQSKLHKTLIQ